MFQGSDINDFNDLEMNQVCNLLTSFVCLFVYFRASKFLPDDGLSQPYVLFPPRTPHFQASHATSLVLERNEEGD